MIQRTSSSSHLRYVLLNSIFSAFALAFLCFSGIGRVRGSTWLPWAGAPLVSELFASLSWAREMLDKLTAITPASRPNDHRFRKPVENIEGLTSQITTVRLFYVHCILQGKKKWPATK